MTLPNEFDFSNEPSYGGGRWDVEALLEDIAEGAGAYADKLENAQDDLNWLRDREAREQFAHAEAHKIVSEEAFSILMAQMREAVAETQEYNVPIFTTHLEDAMYRHSENLINLEVVDPGYIRVNIYENMYTLLGSPDIWVEATKQAKGDLGLGGIANDEVRSKIWREIYQIDREGGTKIHPTSDEDVTEKYVGKYFRTIASRLKAMADTTVAPWWYYIHHGNTPTGEGAESGGTPYPEIEPTNFVWEAEHLIQYAFEDAYEKILEEAERVYSKLLRDDYNIEGKTDTFTEVEDQLTDVDYDDLLREVGKAEKHDAVETAFVNGKWYDVIKTSGGNIGLRYNLKKNR